MFFTDTSILMICGDIITVASDDVTITLGDADMLSFVTTDVTDTETTEEEVVS